MQCYDTILAVQANIMAYIAIIFHVALILMQILTEVSHQRNQLTQVNIDFPDKYI